MRHPTSIVDALARVDPSAELGPYCVVGAGAVIGTACRLHASCVVTGATTLGARNAVHPFAVIGADPQDRSFAGEETRLVVGDDNCFREHVTVHRGTAKDHRLTRLGDRNLLMAGCHVAHDCDLGSDITLANATLLAGHVVLGDYVVTGGAVGIAPRVRVGTGAFLAAGARVERDVPPFVIASGDRARVRALNVVGLERRGVTREHRRALELAFRHLYAAGLPLAVARRNVDPALAADPFVATLLAFFETAPLPTGRPSDTKGQRGSSSA